MCFFTLSVCYIITQDFIHSFEDFRKILQSVKKKMKEKNNIKS